MRSARPVGLSQDGRSLLVATSDGEELAVAVDERLHAALRGDQPRLGQLEIEMEQTLTPRDIQSRIRSGQSLEEVGRVAGLPLDRVERFAAPVLAEREHIALLAMSSSVRRRDETSGHRLLRLAVTERLVRRGIDIDTVDWDASRREDGRWLVSANYTSGEASRQAVFVFDLSARFSVADNDEARWVLGEQSSSKGPQPGRRRPSGPEGEGDTEPTLDLSDELALVRVIQPAAEVGPADEPLAAVRPSPPRGLYSVPDQVEDDEQEADEESPLDTLDRMLEGAPPVPAEPGLSDASAVPDTDNRAWEPAVAVDYPVEPGPESHDTVEVPEAAPEEPAAGAEEAGQQETPSPRQPGKRKRAAVPSWDEIMFGGPPRPR